ncbi:MAG: isoprenyl transferase [Clostridia bacterium]|nr:isoprenyl transferase [Clostridia bacterium]
MNNENMPNHIAIIMDGNRRWAREHKMTIPLGHKSGAETLKKIVRYVNKIGLKYLTVYAFSTENWKRSEEEISALMFLFRQYLDESLNKANSENIRVRVLGDISRLSKDLQDSINKIEAKTRDNTGVSLNLAINYGGRDEIVKATRKIAEKIKREEITINDITEDFISKEIYTYDIPDPDLLIRVGGELRLSGFLLWQSSYSELIFMNKYWPDFDEKDIDYAIEEFKKRNRRFGAN